jgi:hypothetical protein
MAYFVIYDQIFKWNDAVLGKFVGCIGQKPQA